MSKSNIKFSEILNEMPAYVVGGDGEITDYKPGMKLSAFGASKPVSDDEKGVRGPLTILKLAIQEGNWDMVQQAADMLEEYAGEKYPQIP